MQKRILQKARKITLVILDVDGVLTDGSLDYGPKGEALKRFYVRDGAAINWLQRAGIEVALLTGRQSPQVTARARDLGLKLVIQSALKKLPAFEKLLKKTRRSPAEVAYMGDDLLDLPVLRRVGLSLAPADAVAEVRACVDWVSSLPGGHGAVREAGELILEAQDQLAKIISPYSE